MNKLTCGFFCFLFSLPTISFASFNFTDVRPVASIRGGWEDVKATDSQHVLTNTFDPVADYYDVHGTWQTQFVWSGFLGLEIPVNKLNHWQTGVSYYQTNQLKTEGTVFAYSLPDRGNTKFEYFVRNERVLFENKWLRKVHKNAYLYLLGGIGAAFNKAYDYEEVPLSNNISSYRKFANNTKTSFTYSIGVGAEIALTTAMRAGVRYQYSDLGKIELGDNNIGNNAQDTLESHPTAANEFLFELAYLFN